MDLLEWNASSVSYIRPGMPEGSLIPEGPDMLWPPAPSSEKRLLLSCTPHELVPYGVVNKGGEWDGVGYSDTGDRRAGVGTGSWWVLKLGKARGLPPYASR